MKLENTINEKINQSSFWNLPEVKEQQRIQKSSPFRSKEDIKAFYMIKSILTDKCGQQFADEYMGEYE